MFTNKLEILGISILLLYREHLDVMGGYDSSDLVKNVLGQLEQDRRPLQGDIPDSAEQLRHYVYNLIENPSSIDKDNIILSLSAMLKSEDVFLKKLIDNFNMELSTERLKNSIYKLREYLTRIYKQKEIATAINRANYEIRTGKVGQKNIEEFTNKLINNLETLNTTLSTKKVDKAIVTELNISNKEQLATLIGKAKKNTNGDGRLKTGWLEYNRMLGGGFRRGETVLVSALQHNYKSGMLRSLFAQLCMFNKPVLKNKNKKPLNLFISFEDDADIAIEFFYKYLYFSEHNEEPDLSNKNEEEIGEYILTKLSCTGYEVILLRVNPAEWTYKSLLNKIVEFEAEGYEIHVLVTDYLSKLPLTYCEVGANGTGFRYMLTTVRDYTSSKDILFINAHQLSTEAKMLVRQQIGDQEFVKYIANKGYYEGSRQLDQVVDLEIHQHIAPLADDEAILTIQRGKRRYPEIIPNKDKYFILPFPNKIPCIPPNLDLNGNYIGFKYSNSVYIPPTAETQDVSSIDNNLI